MALAGVKGQPGFYAAAAANANRRQRQKERRNDCMRELLILRERIG
jgi:hypothetical protein